MTRRLVLSVYPGIDLLGRAFEEEGYCVVRGPDLIFGGDVRTFRAPSDVFEGVIGGPPCQNFTTVNRNRDTSIGEDLMLHYQRIVCDAAGEWFLCENVPGVTELVVEGFQIQRFTVDCREVGNRQRRLRVIQFGSRDSSTISLERDDAARRLSAEPAVMSAGVERKRVTRRLFEECCELQGLPRDFKLPGHTVEGAFRAIANGVPMELGRALARAVTGRSFLHANPKCICGCGRDVPRDGLQAGPACRKRMQRKRDMARLSSVA